MSNRSLTRRTVTAGLAAGAAAALLPPGARSATLGYKFRGPAADRGLGLAPPAACTPGTVGRTAGPFYTPSTPRRTRLLEPDSGGEPLVLQGLVLMSDCRPVPGAVVDLWHCDERGRYDNSGFRYRGHQFTDAAGAFRFKTVRPGHYTGRTPHFHVKVQGEKTRLLTTQLYFPDLREANSRDFIYRDELLLRLDRVGGHWRARFDFVLAPA
ncbi:MAG: intradiol ring-cleavage dioxygenase [Rhodospirillaceae bacterium]|nr:intradiol ring-cleavage dioxygenase [Rhodospirillaceae bacterium]MDE0619035.1 intradiol ring-cleavage dioxygenase [Rhodospirillaceae bacterium]